jgi:hypothetical protein
VEKFPGFHGLDHFEMTGIKVGRIWGKCKEKVVSRQSAACPEGEVRRIGGQQEKIRVNPFYPRHPCAIEEVGGLSKKKTLEPWNTFHQSKSRSGERVRFNFVLILITF